MPEQQLQIISSLHIYTSCFFPPQEVFILPFTVILRGEGKNHPEDRQSDEHQEIPEDQPRIAARDAVVDDRRDDQRNEQVHRRLKKLEQRREDALLPVLFQKYQQLLQL